MTPTNRFGSDAPPARPTSNVEVFGRLVEPSLPMPRQETRTGAGTDTERLVVATYAAEPMLSLTAAQASRLWHLDAATSVPMLERLVEAGVLSKTPAGGYHRADVLPPMDPAHGP